MDSSSNVCSKFVFKIKYLIKYLTENSSHFLHCAF
nr:MAG TPA: hypothetical protein [Caudoviricetes sp.]